ncbi:MAG: hypothetical protein ACRD1C_10300 [Terriglobales bacterium]
MGVGLRFWMGSQQWGLALALAGVMVLLSARVAQRLRRRRLKENDAHVQRM